MDMVNGSSSDEGMFEFYLRRFEGARSRVGDGGIREFVPPFILLMDC